jgi:UDP-N-acetyl-2-amino-2-deoxyglucuronate dehydrogenase
LEKSGGVAMNIGIHFFDFMTWMFGKPLSTELHLNKAEKMAGVVDLEWARVRWFLSVDKDDLPEGYLENGKPAYRSLTLDGEEIEFSDGFTDLHTKVYQDILDGRGYGLKEAKTAIELVHNLRHSEVVSHQGQGHPFLK